MTAKIIPIKRIDHHAELGNALTLLKVLVAQGHGPVVINEVILKAERELDKIREQRR